jgi:hypothetical protein
MGGISSKKLNDGDFNLMHYCQDLYNCIYKECFKGMTSNTNNIEEANLS